MVSLSKVCEIEDFSDPDLVRTMRTVFAHELVRFGPAFPDGHEHRKHWEVAMAMLAFERHGVLRSDAEVLGVGAGNEPTIFALTRFVRRVFATDLYLSSGWEESADSSMLVAPEEHWPFAWNPRRLVVQHMDGRSLRFDDASFDGIFSSSSIEHFGSDDEIARSLDEMCRVLKPGGVAAIASEFLIRGKKGFPGVRLFDEAAIDEIVVGDRPWDVVDGFDAKVSDATLTAVQDHAEAVQSMAQQIAHLGALLNHHVVMPRYPHVVMTHGGQTWTSFHLALRRR